MRKARLWRKQKNKVVEETSEVVEETSSIVKETGEVTRRYGPLRGPTSSSCRGLWPRLFLPSGAGQKKRLQAQTLPDATPPIGQIHPFRKMAIAFEPLN